MTIDTTQPGLKRRPWIGLLTLYGVGVMVGAGLDALVGSVAGRAGAAGSGVALIWTIE